MNLRFLSIFHILILVISSANSFKIRQIKAYKKNHMTTLYSYEAQTSMIEEEKAYDEALKILGADSHPKKVAMVAMRFRNIAIHFQNLSDCKDAYYMKVISVFIQRVVTSLLQEDDELKAMVKNSKNLRPNERDKIISAKNLGVPSMSSINSALLDDSIRGLVWGKLNITAEFPILPDDLLYGVLSQSIHKPDMKALIIGMNAPENFKNFFRHLATSEKIKVIEYDEEMAARGEVEVSNEIKERYGEN